MTMTQGKIEKTIKEMVEKYGDMTVAVRYDYYKTMLIDDKSRRRLFSNVDDNVDECITEEIPLSKVMTVVPDLNHPKLKNLELICRGKIRRYYIPEEVEESKNEYESDEQRKLRKEQKDSLRKFFMEYATNALPFCKNEFHV
jgi:hypothetical protein